MSKYTPVPIDDIKRRDTCLALTFLLLLFWLFFPIKELIYVAMALLLIGMVIPQAMTWPAQLWFGLSFLLGGIMSKVILSAIYCLFLIPVGLFRRCIGKDAMQLSTWKDNKPSAFFNREHTYTAEDLYYPY